MKQCMFVWKREVASEGENKRGTTNAGEAV